MSDLQNPAFHDETKAREWLESHLWPDGPVCPHCGSVNVKKLSGKSHRPGLHQCNEKECRQQFTVTVGTLYERSKIPLSKWLMATYLLSASKKGMSTRQLSRMLGVSVKSTWFMMHRIRESMRESDAGPLGGQNKVVEADETYVGGKAKNAKRGKPVPEKHAVFALVERDGEARSFHVTNVNAKTLRPVITKHASRKSYLMTDESPVYPKIGGEFSGHGTVNHSANEYVRGTFWYTNTVESYFAILKRGIMGSFHNVSEAHLHRYLAEFDFRYNTRHLSDAERAEELLTASKGKRLMYQQPSEAENA